MLEYGVGDGLEFLKSNSRRTTDSILSQNAYDNGHNCRCASSMNQVESVKVWSDMISATAT